MTSANPFARCPSCGAPQVKKLGDVLPPGAVDRCPSCVHADGSPKSQEEIVARLSAYLVDALELSPHAAREIAAERIASLPAWGGRG
jgi:uncharacterized Zn finger protein (UPF0148 family)